MSVRKGILLRLTPEVLERVDQARGALDRTAWITNAILQRLQDFEEPESLHDVAESQEEHGEPYELEPSSPEQGSPSHPVDSDEDGESSNGSDTDGESRPPTDPVHDSPPFDESDMGDIP